MHRCHSNSWPLATLFVICGTLCWRLPPVYHLTSERDKSYTISRDEWRRDVTPIHKLRRSLYIHSVRALLTHLPTYLSVYFAPFAAIPRILRTLTLAEPNRKTLCILLQRNHLNRAYKPTYTHTYSKNARHRPRRSSRPTQGTHTSHPPALHPHN